MPSFTGLYYPYIHFQDEGWLKASALYWDRMTRIVPNGMRPRDTPDVRQLIDADFVNGFPPSSFEASKLICKLVEQNQELMVKHFYILNDDPTIPLSSISDAKMGVYLFETLTRLGLAKPRRNTIVLHRQLAGVYMTALAEEMAPMIGARPVAATGLNHVAGSGLTVERLLAALLERSNVAPTQPGLLSAPTPGDKKLRMSAEELEQAMVTVAIKTVIPNLASDIPAGDIIAFRKTYAGERAAFQAEFTKFLQEMDFIRDMNDIADIQKTLNEQFAKRFQPKLDVLEKGIRRAGWDVVDNTVAASFATPVIVSAALSASGMTLPAAATGIAGISLGLWSIFRKRQKGGGRPAEAEPRGLSIQDEGQALPATCRERHYKRPPIFCCIKQAPYSPHTVRQG
jgi:hypothetical protein